MTNDDSKPSAKSTDRDARQQRLSDALRANLRRRKQQQRDRRDAPPDDGESEAEGN